MRSVVFKQALSRRTAGAVAGAFLVLALGACSSFGTPPQSNGTATKQEPESTAVSSISAAAASFQLDGVTDLHIGQAVPKGSTWAERGAQASDTCRTISSPAHPGAYAIVIDNTVQRITVGQRSTLKLEGLGIGSTESAVRARFPDLAEELHKYESPPAKYLTSPNASSSSAGVRFEIGADGKVKLIHAGLMPVLAYVEGCA
jgi:hypothetical protein